MDQKSYQSQASSSSSMFNGDVRKVNTLKNPRRHFYALPSAKGLFNHYCGMLEMFDQHLTDFEFCFVQDDVESCEFFVWVDEGEELGYFKNNEIGAAHGRKTRLMEKVQSMVKAKGNGNNEVWRARLMDKVDRVGSELRLIKFMIVIIYLFEFCNMLLYCSKVV